MSSTLWVSFLLYLIGMSLGKMAYDEGAWRPIVQTDARHTGPDKQERIQIGRDTSRPNSVMLDVQKNLQNILSVATDRVGQFFRPSRRPSQINLQSRNPPLRRPQVLVGHHHQLISDPRHVRPVVHQRPAPQVHQARGPPSVRIVKPSLNQAQASLHTPLPARPPVQVSSVRTKENLEQRRGKMIQQLKSVEAAQVMRETLQADKEMKDMKQMNEMKEMKEMKKMKDMKENKEPISDPILLDFEDNESRSQVHRSAFIEPSELDALQSARDGLKHSGEHEHGHDHDGTEHHNSTQNEDPHGPQQFCVDISEYLDLKWVVKDSEECHVTFTSQCETKSENVCMDVTETKCEVVPYKECQMGLEQMEYTEKKLAPKLFEEKSCYQGKKKVPHTKLFPNCKNVTKQNCVTLWETDDKGDQIWAGTEQCEPVTWQECKLVEKEVQFIVPEVTCSTKQELWYHEPEPSSGVEMTNTFTCKILSSSHCSTQTRPDCKQITWSECREKPVTECKPKKVHVPTQELLHRKKCLLEDDVAPSSTADSDYGTPRADPLSSYEN